MAHGPLHKRGQEKNVSAGEMEDSKMKGPLNQQDWYTYEFTGAEEAWTGLAAICTGWVLRATNSNRCMTSSLAQT